MGGGEAWCVHCTFIIHITGGTKDGSRFGASSSLHGKASWKALWKLRVQPKIRVFGWCVMKNILPAFGELQRRHIRDAVVCPMCGHRDESLFHALV